MIIEMVGTQGVGKSTLTNELLKSFSHNKLVLLSSQEAVTLAKRRWQKKRSISVFLNQLWKIYLLLLLCRYALFHFSYTVSILIYQINRPIKLHFKCLIIKQMLSRWVQYEIFNLHLQNSEIVLIDGGSLHFCVSLFVSEHEYPAIKKFKKIFSLTPKIDFTIFLAVPFVKSTAREKLRKRKSPVRTRGLDDALKKQFLQNQHQLLQLAIELAMYNGWEIKYFENSGNVQEAVRAISNIIHGQIG